MLPVSILLLFATTAENNRPRVDTDSGPLLGVWQSDGVAAFHGVPFAAPPTGKLRWREPRPPTPWKAALDASQHKKPCFQADLFRGVGSGSEDCLYLSLYAPPQCLQNQTSLCPVMYWVHGGAWLVGDNLGKHGRYNGSTLALRHGVIVVAVNYRLDAFGWLALKEFANESADGSYGNFGLKDQRAGLQWVQRNVGAFGGDRQRVTLFGQSAGGFSVCQHLVSPKSDGLFSRAIMMSGGCNGPWLIQDGQQYSEFGDQYARALGCPPTADPEARLACMRSKSTADAILPWLDFICFKTTKPTDPWCTDRNHSASSSSDSSSSLLPRARAPPPLGAFGLTAVVDGAPSGLPSSPLKMMRAGRINRSPSGEPLQVIMGTVLDEMAMFIVAAPVLFRNMTLPPSRDAIRLAITQLASSHPGWNATTIEAVVREYVDAHPLETDAYRLTRLGTDVIFRCATRDAARALSAAGVSVHLYSFQFRTTAWHDPTSLRCQLLSEIGCGVHHAVDVPFVFDASHYPKGAANASVSAGIQSYWTNLAATGDPNKAGSAVPHAWPAYDALSDQHLVIGPDGAFGHGHGFGKRACDLFASFPPNPF